MDTTKSVIPYMIWEYRNELRYCKNDTALNYIKSKINLTDELINAKLLQLAETEEECSAEDEEAVESQIQYKKLLKSYRHTIRIQEKNKAKSEKEKLILEKNKTKTKKETT